LLFLARHSLFFRKLFTANKTKNKEKTKKLKNKKNKRMATLMLCSHQLPEFGVLCGRDCHKIHLVVPLGTATATARHFS
jgi:hypothetical protein